MFQAQTRVIVVKDLALPFALEHVLFSPVLFLRGSSTWRFCPFAMLHEL